MPTELERAKELLTDLRGAASLCRAITHAELDELESAIAAALQAQQPGAQAVAWINYKVIVKDGEVVGHEPGELSFKRLAYGYNMSMAEPLFTHPQPPSIPEPSEDDVEAAKKTPLPNKQTVLELLTGDGIGFYDDVDILVHAIITTDRTRLRERIGGGGS